jgi:PAS domain S-box-containing protein
MTSSARLIALGGFEITDSSGKPLGLPTRKARALLTYLALNTGKRFTRDHLSALLWGDQAEANARQSVRQALSAIRLILGPAVVSCDAEYVCCPAGRVACDTAEFQAAAGAPTLSAAEHAQRLYCGDLLEGHEVGQPLFDDWLNSERERLREIARTNLGNILSRRLSDQDLSRAIAAANSLISVDPFDEPAYRTLMRLYARQGRLPKALRQFQQLSLLLREEFGVLPEEETTALYDELCRNRGTVNILNKLSDYAFVLEQLVCCVVVTDLGSHIIGWNKAAEAEFGFSKDFMIGQKPTFVYAPKRDQSLSDRLLNIARVRGRWSSRVKLLSKDGRECYQIRTIAPLFDREGDLIGAFGMGIPTQ